MSPALASALTIQIAGHKLIECPLCSAMVPELRLPRHIGAVHPGHHVESAGDGSWNLTSPPEPA